MKCEIESNKYDFDSNDSKILRENLLEIEEKYRQVYADNFYDSDSNNFKQLWLRLLRMSVNKRNVHLCLIIIAKMKLVQLALLIKSTINSTKEDEEISSFMAFSYIIDYFKFSDVNLTLARPKIAKDPTMHLIRKLIRFYTNRCDWSTAFDTIERIYQGQSRLKTSNNTLVYFELGKFHEIDENFEEALICYEKLETYESHLIRVMLKKHLHSFKIEMDKFCKSRGRSLELLWARFALSMSSFDDANDIFSRHDDFRSFVTYNFARDPNLVEKRIYELLPEKMRNFLNSDTTLNQNCWRIKRNVDYISSVASSLDPKTRAGFSELAVQYCFAKHNLKTSTSLLCLNQYEAFIGLTSKYISNPLVKLQIACQYGTPGELMPILFDFLNHPGEDTSRRLESSDILLQNDNNGAEEQLFEALLTFGLFKEALQVFSINSMPSGERIMAKMVEHLNKLIIDKHRGSQQLLDVDPMVDGSTLEILCKSIKDTSQILATHVISSVILLITIYLLKFNAKGCEENDLMGSQRTDDEESSLGNLEVMFENLSGLYFEQLNFSATDTLINSLKSLITAVKDKLDSIICESDTIRRSFKHAVETTATRCMIESQYKSAAMLYSHIEDNESAIKCLMRMGEVDVVINYSLLVKNITVNRLTINYLKHLNVDSVIIEDFIAKSKL